LEREQLYLGTSAHKLALRHAASRLHYPLTSFSILNSSHRCVYNAITGKRPAAAINAANHSFGEARLRPTTARPRSAAATRSRRHTTSSGRADREEAIAKGTAEAASPPVPRRCESAAKAACDSFQAFPDPLLRLSSPQFRREFADSVPAID
jgi:hypothetical protein